MAKDRGIETVDAHLGNLSGLIANTLNRKEQITILEAGCGHGVAMIELKRRFGDRIDIVGFNYSAQDGGPGVMAQHAIEKGLYADELLRRVSLPRFVYCDANRLLPFKDNSFDIIYSVASVYLYDDKVGFFAECNRMLARGGIARIDPRFGVHDDVFYGKPKHIPREYSTFWSIWDRGAEVQPEIYFSKIRGIEVVTERGNTKCIRPFLEILKQDSIDFGLRFVSAIDLNVIWTKWGGVKSIYTTQLVEDFIPRYRRQ